MMKKVINQYIDFEYKIKRVMIEMIFGNRTNDQIGSILRSDHIKSPLERKKLNVLRDELTKLDTFNRLAKIYTNN